MDGGGVDSDARSRMPDHLAASWAWAQRRVTQAAAFDPQAVWLLPPRHWPTKSRAGRGVAKDEAKAAALFKQGCEGGDAQGCSLVK